MHKSLSAGLRFCTSFFLTALLCACGSEEKKAGTGGDLLSQRAAFEVQAFEDNLVWGDTVSFTAMQTDSVRKFDSVQLFLDNVKMQTLRPSALQFSMGSRTLSVGTHFFRLAGFEGGTETGSGSASFRLLSDLQPASLAYEVVKTFPHNPASFTQGLE